MPIKPRLLDPTGYYHVISRGNNKQRLFVDADDYDHFLKLIHSSLSLFPVSLFRYVLMPNHFHLLVRPNGDYLPRFMQRIKLLYAWHFSRRYGFVGHVWQGRYKSLHVATDAYLQACGEYIENNPVRAGLCMAAEDWNYSSACRPIK